MNKILIVDDNFANRQLIIEILRKHAVCDVAVNGEEAIEAYNLSLRSKSERYDVILLDIEMPGLDGLEFLKLLREQEGKIGICVGKGVSVIMVTAYKEHFIDAFRTGCDDYLLKPIVPARLLKKINEKLGIENKK